MKEINIIPEKESISLLCVTKLQITTKSLIEATLFPSIINHKYIICGDNIIIHEHLQTVVLLVLNYGYIDRLGLKQTILTQCQAHQL